MKPGLIFDLDGTLVDSLAGIAASLNYALAASNLPIHPLEKVREFIGDGAQILIRRAATDGANTALLGELVQAFKAHYEVAWPTGTTAYEGIGSLLEQLQNERYLLAVLSNKPHPFTTSIVSQLFPNIQFSAVLGQRAGIPHKPDPTGALEIARMIQLAPTDCMVIGDSTMDLETAQRAGMRAIAVSWGFHERERLLAAGAAELAEDPAALLDTIRKLSSEMAPV